MLSRHIHSHWDIFKAYSGLFRHIQHPFPLGKITPWGRPKGVLEKRPDVLRTSLYGPICNSKRRICSATSMGRTQDVNLTIIHKFFFKEFKKNFFFVISSVYQTLYCQSELKTWYVLFSFYYVPRRFDQNRTIRGRPLDVVCRLGCNPRLFTTLPYSEPWHI